MILTPTMAALLGSFTTAVAIFAGGLAVEAYKRRRNRAGMALALAGAIDALLGLIETRRMIEELEAAMPELQAGRPFEIAALISDNTPFRTITMSYASHLGQLGGDLPFRVARFLTYTEGLQHDLARLERNRDKPNVQARLIDTMNPLWETTQTLGQALSADLKRAAGEAANGRKASRRDG